MDNINEFIDFLERFEKEIEAEKNRPKTKKEIKKIKKEQKRDNPYGFKISKSQAFKIANANENLKTDYYKRSKKNITYLGFDEKDIKLKTLKGKKYWQIQILSGEVSSVEYGENYTNNLDGFFNKEDLKKLRCLIDVETGEYIYYPKEK